MSHQWQPPSTRTRHCVSCSLRSRPGRPARHSSVHCAPICAVTWSTTFRFVELAARIPAGLKLRGMHQKYLLKRIAQKWLPHEMIYHKKQGFEAPMGRWLRGPLLGFFDSIVSRENVERAGILRYEEIARIRDEHVEGRRKHSKVLFSVLMLHAWLQRR
jgi:asparagine synthetase B (glutamine-hydrolysing)